MVKTSEEHKAELELAVSDLIRNGFDVVKLNGRVPDAIAYKGGKFYPVELIGRRKVKNKGWVPQASRVSKVRDYSHIGELIVYYFRFLER